MAEDAWRVAATIRAGFFQEGFIQNLADVRNSQGLLRILLNIPLVTLYVIFGFGRFISIGYSFITSAINVILIYNITRRLFNRRAGLIASLIWTLVPLDVLIGGVVSTTSPLVTISLLSLLLLVKASMQLSWRDILLALVLVIFIGLYCEEIGVSLFILTMAAAILLATQTNRIRFTLPGRYWVYIIALVSLLLLTFLFSTADINTVFSRLAKVANNAGVFLHLVFFLVSLTVIQNDQRRNSMLLISLFLIAMLGLAFSISKTQDVSLLLLGEPYLFAFVPIVIAEGVYFSKLLTTKFNTWFVGLMIGLALASLSIVYGDHELISDYATLNFGDANVIVNFSQIVAGFAVIAVVGSPGLLSSKWRSKAGLAVLLLFAFLFGIFPAIWETLSPHKETMRSAEQGYQFLQKQPVQLPVYFVLNNKRDLYSFIQGLDNEQTTTQLSLRRDIVGLDKIGNGYIVVPEGSVDVIPDSWLELIATGHIQNRDIIYRSLTESTAINELEKARELVEEVPTEENQDRLFAAQVNSGQLCPAYNTWIKRRLEGNSLPDYIQISEGLDCFNELIHENISLSESLTPIFESLASITSVYDPDLDTMVWSIYQREFIYGDPRTFSFEVDVKPNSFYLYTGWFKAKEEATLLYWELGDWEEFVSRSKVPTWTHFAALIYSGDNWEGETAISLYPTLIGNYGFVYLSDIKFIKISATQN